MKKKRIAGIALAGMTCLLSSCGGGSGNGTTAKADTQLGTSTSPDIQAQTPTGGTSVLAPVKNSTDGTNNGTSNGASPPPADNTGGGPAVACDGVIDHCFDVANLRIAKYKDDRQAAASYTFDDGYPSSFTIAGMFEKRNLRASFYIIAGKVASEDWAKWKALSDKGHEIGNHSMTHELDMGNPALTDAQLDQEINQAQSIIGQQIGIVPKVFAFPWHSYTAHAKSIALQHHIAIRDPDPNDPDYSLAFFDNAHAPDLNAALASVDAQLADTVKNGGWFVAAGHGIDGDGWSPVTTQFLEDHLSFAQQYASSLWIDTYLNVSRYRLCRNQLTAQATVDSAQQMTVSLNGSYDPQVCNAPLTVAIPVLKNPGAAVSASTENGAAVPAKLIGGNMLLSVAPGKAVHVKIN